MLPADEAELCAQIAWGAGLAEETFDERLLDDVAERALLLDASDVGYDWVVMSDVALYLLHCMTRDEVRDLMSKLDAVIMISRPHGREWFRQHGPTPPHERVTLRVIGEVDVRLDAKELFGSYPLGG